MKIELIETAGIASVYKALHLPFGKNEKSPEYRADDNDLIERLVKAGPEHSKVMRGLMYWIEIKAPIYWWREMETYRIGRERMSCESTMHIECKELIGEKLQAAKANIPMGLEQRAIDMFSAQCLRNIYRQRKHHRLPEWVQFCEFIKKLPYAKRFVTC